MNPNLHESTAGAPGSNPVEGGAGGVALGEEPENVPVVARAAGRKIDGLALLKALTIFLQDLGDGADVEDYLLKGKVTGRGDAGDVEVPEGGRTVIHRVLIVDAPGVRSLRDVAGLSERDEEDAAMILLNGRCVKNRCAAFGWTVPACRPAGAAATA